MLGAVWVTFRQFCSHLLAGLLILSLSVWGMATERSSPSQLACLIHGLQQALPTYPTFRTFGGTSFRLVGEDNVTIRPHDGRREFLTFANAAPNRAFGIHDEVDLLTAKKGNRIPFDQKGLTGVVTKASRKELTIARSDGVTITIPLSKTAQKKWAYRFLYDVKLPDGRIHTITVQDGIHGDRSKYLPELDRLKEFLALTPADHISSINTISLNSSEYYGNGYWARKFKDPYFRAAASVGVQRRFLTRSRSMDFYFDRDGAAHSLELSTYYHEFGHLFAYKLFRSLNPPPGWITAMKRDGRSVSKYADHNPAEDWAETVNAYLTNPENPEIRELFKYRFELLDQYLSGRRGTHTIEPHAALVEKPPILPVDPLAAMPERQSAAGNVLLKNGLAPSYILRTRNAEFKFGSFFTDGDGRIFAVADVKVGGRTARRVYYRSNSSVAFRVLPAVNEDLPGISGYDKAVGEGSLTLPSEIQAALADRLKASQTTESGLPKITLDKLEGIIPVNRNIDEYRSYRQGPDYLGHFVTDPVELLQPPSQKVKTGHGRELAVPSQVKIASPSERPDYSRPIRSYSINNSVYGEVQAIVYPSRNGHLEYTLLRDSSGRIWFSDIGSAKAPLNSHGVREEVIEGGELLTPRWEYMSQIPEGYVGSLNRAKPEYADSWRYLREIPEIRRWYLENNLSIPE